MSGTHMADEGIDTVVKLPKLAGSQTRFKSLK